MLEADLDLPEVYPDIALIEYFTFRLKSRGINFSTFSGFPQIFCIYFNLKRQVNCTFSERQLKVVFAI